MYEKIVRAIKENLSLIPRKMVDKATWSPFDIATAEKWNSKLVDLKVPTPAFCGRENASWTLLPLGWVKANFDGATKGSPGKAGSGCVLRDNAGAFIAAFAMDIGTQTNHVAEAVGAYHAVNLAFNMNMKCLQLEGDSKNIIDCILGLIPPSWTIKKWIKDTIALLSKFDKVKVSHAYREANKVADYFANEGVKKGGENTWRKNGYLHSDVKALIYYDSMHGREVCLRHDEADKY